MPATRRLGILFAILVIVATAPAYARSSSPAKPSPQAAEEQALFKRLRAVPYFAPMTDEQLRRQPLPPGFKNWQEFLKTNDAMNSGLNWVLVAPSPRLRAHGEWLDPDKVDQKAFAQAVMEKAEAGHATYQLQLGLWYLTGSQPFIRQDERAAFMWFQRAAEQRVPGAIDHLSYFCENGGPAIARDWVEALKWTLVHREIERTYGADTGQTDARIERLRAGLTPEEAADAEARAQAWLAAHPARSGL